MKGSKNKSSDGPRSSGQGISAAIERALAAAGLRASREPKAATPAVDQSFPTQGNPAGTMPSASPPPATFPMGVVKDLLGRRSSRAVRQPGFAGAPAAPATPAYPGQFTTDTYRSSAGTLEYKLYVPLSYRERATEAFPLIVMLHGCTQSPDDFAAGTRMNALAEKHGFLVAYPAQTVASNSSKCWNWFRAEDQERDLGEPALIAGMTREIAARYRIDGRRVFVAGLSAGAAMAVVLGAAYPELYAGVGAHSGLARGAAHDVPSALAAMRSGSSSTGARGRGVAPGRKSDAQPVPTIVFHGDRDHTVDVKNGLEIVEHALRGRDRSSLKTSVEEGVAPGGGRFTRTMYAEGNRVPVEHWMLHGAGHAWSGGSPNGSFTDAHGPDASSAMVRFFLSQPAGRTV